MEAELRAKGKGPEGVGGERESIAALWACGCVAIRDWLADPVGLGSGEQKVQVQMFGVILHRTVQILQVLL